MEEDSIVEEKARIEKELEKLELEKGHLSELLEEKKNRTRELKAYYQFIQKVEQELDKESAFFRAMKRMDESKNKGA